MLLQALPKRSPVMSDNQKKNGPVTIFDVAREAAVSYSTVSRVLNQYEHVRESTRQRVLAAMDKLGYIANPQARSLAGGQSQIIGLLVHDLNSGYTGEIVHGIDDELTKNDYELMLYTTHRHKDKESSYVSMLTRGLVAGLLLVLPRAPEVYLHTLREQQFPHVFIDHQGLDSASPVIKATNWQGAYDATTYLIDLGHQHIGFITGHMEAGSAIDRLYAYKAALSDHNITVNNNLIVEGDFRQPTGYQTTKALLKCSPRPTAIFACNDAMAFGAIEAIREQGLGVPHDISVIGFDDILQSEFIHPPLTTVRQPLRQMGRVAAHTLLEHIKDPDRPTRHIELATHLIIRDSCKSPKESK